MHKYWRHLGDYAKKTRHLTMLEHGAFTLLLDWCYDHEKPLPEGREAVFRLVGARAAHEKKAVWGVLNEFFTLSAGGWVNGRVQAELVEYQGKSEKTRSAAAKRWQSERNADACGVHDGCNASRARSDNQQPATNNQSTSEAALPGGAEAENLEEISIENVGAGVGATVILGRDGAAEKKERGGAGAKPRVRVRNEVFDALVVVTGTPLDQVTRALGGQVAAALRDIKEVCPEVTVEEVRKRAAVYRQKWPKVSLSPSALAKHWGSLGSEKKEGGAEVARVSQGVGEPTWDWREVARVLGIVGGLWAGLERGDKVRILRAKVQGAGTGHAGA